MLTRVQSVHKWRPQNIQRTIASNRTIILRMVACFILGSLQQASQCVASLVAWSEGHDLMGEAS